MVLLAGVMPWLVSLAAHLVFGVTQYVHEPLHEWFELAGSCIALGVAMLLLLRLEHEPDSPHLLWVVAALVAMGSVDMVHGMADFGVEWSWFERGGTLVGGMLVALVWLPLPAAAVRRSRWLVLLVAGLALAGSVTIWVRPDWLRAPWGPGGYVLPVRAANALGGLGFLAAAAFFGRRYLRQPRTEDLVFASYTLLFGAASLFFGFSEVWAADWWVWHVARLLAYTVVLVAAYEIVAALYQQAGRRSQQLEQANRSLQEEAAERAVAEAELARHREHLEELVRARTIELEAANVELRDSRRAAINLMEDALAARRLAEEASAELRREVAERKRAEEELRQSRERLAWILDATGVGLWLNELPLGSLNWDGRTRELFFIPPDVHPTIELFWGRLHPDDREPTRVAVETAIGERGLYAMDHRAVDPETGEVRWIRSVGRASYAADGTPLRFDGVNFDITARKQAEEALRDSEEKFRSAFANAAIGFAMNTPDGRFVDANPAYCQITGYSVEELRGMAFDQLLHADDAAENLRLVERMLSRQIADFVVENRYLRKDGQAVWVRKSVSLVRSAEGLPQWLIALVEDVTERRRAEEALRASREDLDRAQAVAHTGSWRLNVQRNELVWSDENWRIFGVPRGTPLTYESFLAAVHPDDRAFVHEKWQAGLRGEPYEIEHRIVVGDEVKWVREWAELEVDPQGKLLGGFGTTQDITANKQVEEALAAAKAAAEAASEAKSRFLANVSHELRTPMNAILGMIDLALRRNIDATAKEFLHTARESADLLLALLNDLLDSAKIESGRLDLEAAPFSLRRVLEQTTQVLAVRASEKGIAFSCRIPPDVPDALVGDQVRLRQILLNLAGNGIKFTERGEVTVSVRAESRGAGEACLEFVVQDTGIGIPPSELDRLFRPFAQADPSTTRRFGGTGLGLAISSSLVAMMGGRLWVESEVGRGSTFQFTVRLPLASEPPREPRPAADVLAVAPCTLRILLVEDNVANQKLAAYILRERGHIVEVASDGPQALAMWQAGRYNVILMDVQMPGLSWLDVAAAIRAREAGPDRVPIIAMTAHAMKGDRERCIEAGMDDYVTKPVKEAELHEVIKRAVGRNVGTELHGASPAEARAADGAGRCVGPAEVSGAAELLTTARQAIAAGDCSAARTAIQALTKLDGLPDTDAVTAIAREAVEALAGGNARLAADLIKRLAASLCAVDEYADSRMEEAA